MCFVITGGVVPLNRRREEETRHCCCGLFNSVSTRRALPATPLRPPLSHLPQAVGLDGVQRAELAVEVEVDLDVEVAVVLAVGPAPEDALRRYVMSGVGEG